MLARHTSAEFELILAVLEEALAAVGPKRRVAVLKRLCARFEQRLEEPPSIRGDCGKREAMALALDALKEALPRLMAP